VPELRRDPLTGDWVIFSESRQHRPEDFEPSRLREDPIENCPFEPGREDRTPSEVDADRPADGDTSDWYVRVVPNKFPALSEPGRPARPLRDDPEVREGHGAHEVVIETPHHDAEWHRQSPRQMQRILNVYARRLQQLRKLPSVRLIQLFKNRGGRAGATLSHPHAQILTLPVIPSRVRRRLTGAKRHHERAGRCYWCDRLERETREGTRLVARNDSFVAWCPRASRSPYQTRVAPRRHDHRFSGLTATQRRDLGELLLDLADRLENVLRSPPYNVLLHTAPEPDGEDALLERISETFHWHLEMVPRVSRMAGLELATDTHLNHTPPETAAEHLRGRTE